MELAEKVIMGNVRYWKGSNFENLIRAAQAEEELLINFY